MGGRQATGNGLRAQGKRVVSTPWTAVVLRDGLKRGALDITDFTWLHLICHTPDMRPILRPRRKDMEIVENYLEEHRNELSVLGNRGLRLHRLRGLPREVKTAMVLDAWIKRGIRKRPAGEVQRTTGGQVQRRNRGMALVRHP